MRLRPGWLCSRDHKSPPSPSGGLEAQVVWKPSTAPPGTVDSLKIEVQDAWPAAKSDARVNQWWAQALDEPATLLLEVGLTVPKEAVHGDPLKVVVSQMHPRR